MKKAPKRIIVPLSDEINPQKLGAQAMQARLRCQNPDCNCHFPGGKVHCPAHKDRTPSFSITQSSEGLVGECHAVHLYHGNVMDCTTEKLRDRLFPIL